MLCPTSVALCAGQPAVFQEFLDYCRSMKHDETPQYLYWRQRFVDEVGGPGFTPLFDVNDNGTPIDQVSQGTDSSESIPSSTSVSDISYPESTEWSAAFSRFDMFMPCCDSHFECVYSLPPEELLAPQEEAIVFQGIQSRLRSVPASQWSHLYYDCPPEALLA